MKRNNRKNNDYDLPEDALVIMVGVAGSGKSTLANKIAHNEDEIISSDKIRGEMYGNEGDQSNPQKVFDELYRRVEERLKDSKFTIVDATSIKSVSRKRLYEIAIKYNKPIRVAVLNIPLGQIKRQNANRKRKVPEEAIDRMFNNMYFEYGNIDEEIKALPNAKVCDVFNYFDKERERELDR